MALPATDTFAGTSYDYLDTRFGWSGVYPNSMWIRSNHCACAAGTTDYAEGSVVQGSARWSGDSFNGNHISEAIIFSLMGSYGIGVAVRMQSGADSYYGAMLCDSGAVLFRRVAGVNTTLASDATSRSAGNTLRLEANDSSLTLKYGGSTILTASDATLSGGSAGVCGIQDWGTLQCISVWGGDDLTPAPANPIPHFLRKRFVERQKTLIHVFQ